MSVIWAKKESTPRAAADRMQLVMWDFLKLVTAAILCGIAVSVAAAGVALLLSGSVEARDLSAADMDAGEATPGRLVVGAGCDGLELGAAERDWHVRIDGGTIDVRVMQTWFMPAEVDDAAVFQVRLPRGAKLKSLAAQSPRSAWAGRKLTADAYAKLSPAAYLDLTRNQLLVTYGPDGDVSTSPMVGLQPGDAITVQYTYVLETGSPKHDESLLLPLHHPEDFNQRRLFPSEDDADLAPVKRPATPGNIWVEWVGRGPARIVASPREISIERDAQPAGAIAGLSWTTNELKPGDQFQLAWLM